MSLHKVNIAAQAAPTQRSTALPHSSRSLQRTNLNNLSPVQGSPPRGTVIPKMLTSKIMYWALARWLSWLERRPIHRKAVGSTPGQGTCGRQPMGVSLSLRCFYLSHILSPTHLTPLSLLSINITLGKDLKIKIKRHSLILPPFFNFIWVESQRVICKLVRFICCSVHLFARSHCCLCRAGRPRRLFYCWSSPPFICS